MAEKDKARQAPPESRRQTPRRSPAHKQTDPQTPLPLSSLQGLGNAGQLSVTEALQLQRSAGNRAVSEWLSRSGPPGPLQAKLTVGAADDAYEREADRVAAQMTSTSAPPNVTHHEDTTAQRKPAAPNPTITPLSDSFEAGDEVERQLSAGRNGGAPLPAPLRAEWEPRFGADFTHVRVHTGSQADQLSRQLGAQAFTHANHIYMAEGKYDPASGAGKRLLAHELTHVVQQGSAGNKAQRAMPIQRKLYVGGNEVEDVETDEGGTDTYDITAMRGQHGDALDVNDPQYREIRGGTKITDADDAWKKVTQAQPAIKQLGFWAKRSMKARLKKWITRNDMLDVKGAKAARVLFQKSEERRYEDWNDVATALLAEEKAKPNKQKEKKLAKKVSKNVDFRRDLADALRETHDIIERLAPEHRLAIWDGLAQYRSKFPHWYPRGAVKQRMAAPVLKRVSSNWVIFHEVMFFLAKTNRLNIFGEIAKSPKLGSVNMPNQAHSAGRIGAGTGEASGRHALIEKNAWVKAARARNMPLGAGASNTTDILMMGASMLNLQAKHKQAIAWGAFVFWNKAYYQVEAKGHSFHEIMDVANLRTGGEVAYDPDAVNPYKTGYNKSRNTDGDNMETQEQVQESVEKFEEQGSGSSEDSVSMEPPTKTLDEDTSAKGQSPQTEDHTPTVQELEPPKRGDIYMVNTPLAVEGRGQDQTVPAGKRVMIVGVNEDAGTVQVEMEMDRNAVRPNVVRGSVSITDLFTHATPSTR
jgi:hypothetical protein